MPSSNWSSEEVARTVADYFDMLAEELSGSTPHKAKHREALAPLLNHRSHKAVEYKHMNISAALDELGLRHIEGYTPMPHYQQALKDAVEAYLAQHPGLALKLKK
jgi:hypothetical protein